MANLYCCDISWTYKQTLALFSSNAIEMFSLYVYRGGYTEYIPSKMAQYEIFRDFIGYTIDHYVPLKDVH